MMHYENHPRAINQPASGNGAIAILFHAGRSGRAVPEPRQGPVFLVGLISERVLKMVISTLTLLYKEPNYYKWIGCKRIQFVILPI